MANIDIFYENSYKNLEELLKILQKIEHNHPKNSKSLKNNLNKVKTSQKDSTKALINFQKIQKAL